MKKELQNLFKIAHQIGIRKKTRRMPYPTRLDTREKCMEYKKNLQNFISHPELFYLQKNTPSVDLKDIEYHNNLDNKLFKDT
jgi:hypothetical protein